MRALVTGHRGYIGSVLVPLLRAAGWSVLGLDCDLYGDCTFGPSEEPTVPDLGVDLREVEVEHLQGVDAVVHLAALPAVPTNQFDALLSEVNHFAAVRLAQRAERAGVERFLLASSCDNYGAPDPAQGDTRGLSEEAPLRPRSAHGRAQVLAEQGLARLACDRFSPTTLRIGCAYGVSARLRLDLVLNELVAMACTTGRVSLPDDGRALLPLVHVEDVARAFVSALEAPREVVHDQAFNIGRPGEAYTLADLGRLVASIAPNTDLELGVGPGMLSRERIDFGKAQRLLAHLPAGWTVRRGVEQLLQAYRRHELSLAELVSSRYRRAERLQALFSAGVLSRDLRRRLRKVSLGL